MGFFRDLGRQVEQFKQTAREATDAYADYECQACGETFTSRPEQCDECGSTDIVSTDE